MTEAPADKTAHFGHREVPAAEKTRLVGRVFHSVAPRYDLMNDLMSLGAHRLVKRFTAELSALRPGHLVLDLAGGTGDMSRLFAPIVGDEGHVVLADINETMLCAGRNRLIDQGLCGNISYALADAENLPFAENSFDCICIAYGLRNVTDQKAALEAMQRALKPGGRVLILEFSQPRRPALRRAFGLYSSLWPRLGKLVSGDEESYRYLVESIQRHPDQETLKEMMTDSGLQDCRCHDVLGGICAIHVGRKAG